MNMRYLLSKFQKVQCNMESYLLLLEAIRPLKGKVHPEIKLVLIGVEK